VRSVSLWRMDVGIDERICGEHQLDLQLGQQIKGTIYVDNNRLGGGFFAPSRISPRVRQVVWKSSRGNWRVLNVPGWFSILVYLLLSNCAVPWVGDLKF